MPPKTILSQDYDGRGVLGNKELSWGPLLWSLRHEGKRGHFLNSRVEILPAIGEILEMEPRFNVCQLSQPLLGEKGEGSIRNHLRNHKNKDR
jgi:hypothetical protein